MSWRVIVGDCVEVMRAEPADSIDAIVTDPPYGLEFMGKEWDSFGRVRRDTAAERDSAYRHDGKGAQPFGYSHGQGGDHRANTRMQVWHQTWATEALRVLKPGAHLLAFGGTRTYHRLVCALEDAGFEIRDTLAWMYGSGFPKSLDVSKAIDKARDDSQARGEVAVWLRPYVERVGFDEITRAFGFKDETMARARWTTRSQPQTPTWDQWLKLKVLCGFGNEMDAEVWRLNGRKGTPGEAWADREVVGSASLPIGHAFAGPTYGGDSSSQLVNLTAPATPAAQQWQGWGTALKPAFEPIVLARKPLSEKTVAGNVQRWGTGALNIDGTRIESDREPQEYTVNRWKPGARLNREGGTWRNADDDAPTLTGSTPSGRWPANVLLDERAAQLLDEQSGELTSGYTDRSRIKADNKIYGKAPINRTGIYEASSGGASRFFYTAKASRRERTGYSGPNDHPTVKPVALMRWLVKLITPPERPCRTCGGTGQRRWTDGSPLETCPTCKGTGTVAGVVLDPFMGTGTTGIAAVSEGFGFVGIDQDAGYVSLAERRIHNEAGLFSVQEGGP